MRTIIALAIGLFASVSFAFDVPIQEGVAPSIVASEIVQSQTVEYVESANAVTALEFSIISMLLAALIALPAISLRQKAINYELANKAEPKTAETNIFEVGWRYCNAAQPQSDIREGPDNPGFFLRGRKWLIKE